FSVFVFFFCFLEKKHPHRKKRGVVVYPLAPPPGPEGGGQDARHKLPDIKSSERPSERMAFLLFELTFN
ncbi:hypothetical protein Q7I60_21090, partial [Escherichia coli]|uniref:hypothetical protein n=1 Tax=Escherichia coli TaxID=562 RepID=UPI003EE6FC39